MFTGKKLEDLSESKEIDISEQITTVVASKYADACVIQNLEFRNKQGQSICNTKIATDPVELEDPIKI